MCELTCRYVSSHIGKVRTHEAVYGGYRLDHLLASAELTVEDCRYEHGWRKEGLSDHSALVASLRCG